MDENDPSFDLVDLGRLAYEPALEQQRRAHARVVAGARPTLILVEHEPVVTLSRRRCSARNLRVGPDELARRQIDLVQSDRGGDITYHGPGQLVIYPIVALTPLDLNIGRYMRLLEQVVIDAVAAFGLGADRVAKLAGVWATDPAREDQGPAKLCAVGVRIERGVTLHGAALNVTTPLEQFQMIVPCGLADRPVTSLEQLLGAEVPSLDEVRRRVVDSFASNLRRARAAALLSP